MAEERAFDDLIKMEIDSDNEDFIVYNILDSAEDIFDKNDDPLLCLTPVVYTTRLDDMKTIKQDLTKLTAEEILKKLHSESTPIVKTESIKGASKSSVESFVKLASVINDINAKARFQFPLEATSCDENTIPSNEANLSISPSICVSTSNTDFLKPPDTESLSILDASFEPSKEKETLNLENVELLSDEIQNFVSDVKEEPEIFVNEKTQNINISNNDRLIKTDLNKKKEHCSCFVVLNDIKGLLKDNQTTVKLPSTLQKPSDQPSIADKKSTNSETVNKKIINEIKLELEEIHTDGIEIFIEDESETRKNQLQKVNKFEIPVLESDETTNHINFTPQQSHNQNAEIADISENSETKENSSVASCKPKRKRKARVYYDTSSTSSDEDYVPDIEINKKSKIYSSSKKFALNNYLVTPSTAPLKANSSTVPKTLVTPSTVVSKANSSTVSKTLVTPSTVVSKANSSTVSKTLVTPSIVPSKSNSSSVPKTLVTPSKVNSSNVPKVNGNKPSGTGSVTIIMADPAQIPFQEKYALVVLTHDKKKVFIYRVNPTKLITDFYVTKQCDEYKLASMYPKEEKIIEQYCCWYKREETIGKICSRKNYPFTIQKFLKQPHTCHADECICCCRKNNNNTYQNKQERRHMLNKSIKIADDWINELLSKSRTATGLVNKALSYTAKVTTEKPVIKESKKYLENYLLCLKNVQRMSSPHGNPAISYELYEIGENGNITKKLLSHNEAEVAAIRKRYQLKAMPVRDAELCCWFKREKLMQELKNLKNSPSTLKSIQKGHCCAYKNCSCCCKPPSAIMSAAINMPSTFLQTTAYEKHMQRVTIKFSAKSKNAMSRASENYGLSKKTTTTDASTAAVVLSDLASRNDNQDLSANILSKFKNLKLGTDSTGKIEVVLSEPAKNLSVGELKVLSEILEYSIKQTGELGLTAEEFCNRINTQSTDVIRVTPPDTTLISINNFAPPPIEDDDDDLTDIDYNPVSTKRSQSKSTEANKKNILSTKSNTNNAAQSMFKALSNLMETKNKYYIDSFKCFFNKPESPDVNLRNVKTFAPVPKHSQSANEFDITTVTEASMTMPVIKETFTLARSPPEASSIAVPGPSGVVQKRGTKINAGISNKQEVSGQTRLSSTANVVKRKMEHVISDLVEKKIRVKPPSELNAPILNTSSFSDNLEVLEPKLTWSTPIALEKQTNMQQIVSPGHQPAYVAPNLKIVSPTPITVKKLYRLNGNPIQLPQSGSNGVHYLTLAPLNDVDSGNKMLDRIMKTPQGAPVASSSGTCVVPPLVPIRPPFAPKKEASDPDMENCIPFRVISK